MTDIDKTKPYVQYAYDVINGQIPACVHTKNACRRFLDDFKRDDIYFNYKKVDRVISFVQILKHHDAPPGVVNTPIVLRPWQQWIVCNIFGWYYTKDNVRRYTRSYIEVSRKSAKTQLMAALGMFSLIEYRSANQILLAASTREQAHRLFDFCKHFGAQLDGTGREIKILRDRIVLKSTGAYVYVLSADAGKSGDGYCPYFAAVDELHQAPNSLTVDTLRSGMTKPGAHLTTITTAGFSKSSYCYEVRQNMVDILAGRKQDDRYFGCIWTIDSDDDWKDKDCWIKASPNLGYSAPVSFYEDMFNAALNSPTDEANFKVKNLNMWGQLAENVWIKNEYIEPCLGKVDPSTWKDDYVFCGIDCGAVHDITAVSYCRFNSKTKMPEFYTEYYLPETCLDDSENKDFYNRVYQQGYLKLTPGNVTDYDKIMQDICTFSERFGNNALIYYIGYDSWNATQLAINLTNAGLRMRPVSQSLGAMNRATKELERLIYGKRVLIHHEPLIQWMFLFCVLRVDHNGNSKPSKSMNNNANDIKARKIDGIIAMLNALTVLLEEGRFIYMQSEDEESDDE